MKLDGVTPEAWTGSTWISSGGAFDLSNLPRTSKYAVEFKDRVYVAGRDDSPDRVDISGIANSTTRAISWTVNNRFMLVEQEDGGGKITGLSKVPGYVLIFKRRTLKRYDGVSTYPEDMINQGAPSQEAIVVAKGLCWWINENGSWVTQGGEPQKISSFMVDRIIKSCTDLENVAAGTDDEHVYWSFSSVTINGDTYSNIVLKYNISQNSWDIYQYPTNHRVYTKYVDSNENVFTIIGDNDGFVKKINVGNTDSGKAIPYTMETQDMDFGLRMFQKEINKLSVVTENVSKGLLSWRNRHLSDSWRKVETISGEVTEIKTKLRGNYFNFKISESTDSGSAIIHGFEFPEGGVKVLDSTK